MRSSQPSQRLGIFGYFIGKKLQCDEAMQPRVLGLVDNTHAAELLDDTVVRDGLPDHQGQILRGVNGQVNESRRVGGDSRGLLAINPR